MKRALSAALLLTLLGVAFLAAHAASAQESPPVYWEFINVDIDVQGNGDLLVTETQKYVFTGPHTNQRQRWIPLDKVDTITGVQVFEAGELLPATTGLKDNQLWIRWSHPLNPPESHTFVLKYRVTGGLHIHDDGDQVYWKALFKDRAATIQSGKVTVRLPASLAGRILDMKSFGVPADARRVDARTVEFVSRGPLPPGQELEVQVTFPHGVLNVGMPAWQQRGAQSITTPTPLPLLFWGSIGFAALLILWAGVGAPVLRTIYKRHYRKKHGRSPQKRDVPLWILILMLGRAEAGAGGGYSGFGGGGRGGGGSGSGS